MDYMFAARDENIKQALQMVARENQLLLQCRTGTFMYEGTWYDDGAYDYSRARDASNRTLHPSKLPEVQALLQAKDFDTQVERSKMDNYVGNLLIEAAHVDDLRRLIPGYIMVNYDGIDELVFNVGDPMTEDQAKAFEERNKEGLFAFNCMHLTTLICP